MADDWRECTIGTLCDTGVAALQTGPFGSQLHSYDYVPDGIPVVPTEALRERRIDHSVLPRISPDKAKELSRHRLKEGDILFARRGVQATGHIGVVRTPEEGFICGTGAIRLRINSGSNEIDRDFLSHVLANPASIAWFKFHAIGATMPNLNESIIRSFPLTLPGLAEQCAIANILGALDDKIELNRRMNETLEEMARALFKSWFVDFDPVRAKAEGRATGVPEQISGLFPGSFVDSDLGPIPQGWGSGPLGHFFTIGLGGAWGEDECSEVASVPVRCLRGIDCHDLAEGRNPDVPLRWLSANQVARRVLSDGTILIEGSGSFCGRSLLWRTLYGKLLGQSVTYSNFCKRLDPICTVEQAAVCWLQMRRSYLIGDLQSFRTGTAFPNLDVHGMLANLMVVVPPESLAREFWRLFSLSQRIDLVEESRTLAELRDALLPRLISGEVRIRQAERFVEQVA